MSDIYCINAGLKLGMDRKETMLLTTPGEMRDLIQIMENAAYERKGNEQF